MKPRAYFGLFTILVLACTTNVAKPFFSALLTKVIVGIGGFVIESLMRDTVVQVTQNVAIDATLKGNIDQILATQQQILDKQRSTTDQINYIQIEIEKRILEEHINDAFSQISSLITEMYSFFNQVSLGNYRDQAHQASNFASITAKVHANIPGAVDRIYLSAFNILNLIRDQALADDIDIVNFNLKLSYAIDKMVTAFRNSIDLLIFSIYDYPFLDGTINNAMLYINELGKWKDARVTSSFTEWVNYILEDGKDSFFSEKVLKNLGINGGGHLIYSGGFLTVGFSTITALSIKKADGFSLQNPVFQIWLGAPGAQKALGATSDAVLMENYDAGGDLWRVEACENVNSPYEDNVNFACFKNILHGKYLSWRYAEPGYPAVNDFDPAQQAFYWLLASPSRCARFYKAESKAGEFLESCQDMTNTNIVEMKQMPDGWDKQALFISTGPDVKLQLYDRTNYAGNIAEMPQGSEWVLSQVGWNNMISSFSLQTDCARFYEKENYKGNFFTICEDQPYILTPSEWSGPIKSVFIPQGQGVILFTDPGYGGTGIQLRLPTPNLVDWVDFELSIILGPLSEINSHIMPIPPPPEIITPPQE